MWKICSFPNSAAIVSRNNPLYNYTTDNEAIKINVDDNLNINYIGKKIDKGYAESIGLYKLTQELITNNNIYKYLNICDNNDYYEDAFQLSIDKYDILNMTPLDITGFKDCIELDTYEDYINLKDNIL